MDCVLDGEATRVRCHECAGTGYSLEDIATPTRERDEARAALALAYPRALQAAAEHAARGQGALSVEEQRRAAEPETLRGWTRHSSGSYWCLHCNATGDAPGDQDCANCGGLGWRGPVQQLAPARAPAGGRVMMDLDDLHRLYCECDHIGPVEVPHG